MIITEWLRCTSPRASIPREGTTRTTSARCQLPVAPLQTDRLVLGSVSVVAWFLRARFPNCSHEVHPKRPRTELFALPISGALSDSSWASRPAIRLLACLGSQISPSAACVFGSFVMSIRLQLRRNPDWVFWPPSPRSGRFSSPLSAFVSGSSQYHSFFPSRALDHGAGPVPIAFLAAPTAIRLVPMVDEVGRRALMPHADPAGTHPK